MAYNVALNGIENGFLYINAGGQNVIYNSVTYTTGQTFIGVAGVVSFSYSGSGSQIVNEAIVVKGANVEFIQNNNEKVFNDSLIFKGADVEILSFVKPLLYSKTRRSVKINPITYTAPSKLSYFGDSFTSGAGVPNAYPAIINGINGIPFTNYGVPGSTVYQGGVAGSNLIDKYNTEISLGYTGQYVSFMYGYNDAVFGINAAWKSNYKAIIQAFITAGWPTNKLIICNQPSTGIQTNLYINEIAAELGILRYNASQRFIESKSTTLFIPGDIHPSTEGQTLIATGLDTFIKR